MTSIRKYLILTLGILLILSSLYISVGYYMGGVAEDKIRMLSQIADNKQANKLDLRFKITAYNRGIFSSQASLEFEYNNSSPLYMTLNIIHLPILKANNLNNQSELYFFKLLFDIAVYESFLQKRKDLFRNVSIVGLGHDLKLKMELPGFNHELLNIFGITDRMDFAEPSDIKSNLESTVLGEISFDNKQVNIIITGEAGAKKTSDGIFNIDNLQYKLNMIIYNNKNYQNVTNIQFQADKIYSSQDLNQAKNQNFNENSGTKVELYEPKFDISITGKLADFINMLNQLNNIKQNKVISLYNILSSTNRYKIESKFDIAKTIIINKYKEDFTIDNLIVDVLFNNIKNKIILNKIIVDSILLNTKTDKLNLEKLNFEFTLDANKDLFSHKNYIMLLSGINNKPTKANQALLMLNNFVKDIKNSKLNLSYNKLVADGLLVGKINSNDLNYNAELKFGDNKNQNSTDKYISFLLELGKTNILFHHNKLSLKLILDNFTNYNDINFSEYLKYFKNGTVYSTDSSTKASLNELEFMTPLVYIDIKGFDINNVFKLSKDKKGYLNNNVKIKFINAEYNNIKTEIDELQFFSKMDQFYKNILVGKNNLSADKINLNYNKDKKNNNIKINKLRAQNYSYLEPKLESNQKINTMDLKYANELLVDEVIVKNNSLGRLKIDNTFEGLDVDDYIEAINEINQLLVQNNSAGYKANYNVNTVESEFLSKLTNFIKSGIDVKNIIRIGAKDDTDVKIGIEINSYLKFLDHSTNRKNIAKSLVLVNKIKLNKDYINNILTMLENEKTKESLIKYHDDLVKIGLIQYDNKDNAVIDIKYLDKLIINNEDVSFWEKELEKIKKGGNAT